MRDSFIVPIQELNTNGQVAGLEDLVRFAIETASEAIPDEQIVPVMLGLTGRGTLLLADFSPLFSGDPRAKDAINPACHAIVSESKLSAAILMNEVWTLRTTDKSAQEGIAPADSPEREEALILHCEALPNTRQIICIPIRDRVLRVDEQERTGSGGLQATSRFQIFTQIPKEPKSIDA